MISGSTGPIFIKFSPYDRYLMVDYRTGSLFLVAQRTLPWQPNLWSDEMGEIGRLTFFRRALAFLNGVEYRNSDFRKFVCDDLATLCKNVANFGPVTPAFKRGKYVQPSSISSLATFA